MGCHAVRGVPALCLVLAVAKLTVTLNWIVSYGRCMEGKVCRKVDFMKSKQ